MLGSRMEAMQRARISEGTDRNTSEIRMMTESITVP